jgi:uncharacterized membrane protein
MPAPASFPSQLTSKEARMSLRRRRNGRAHARGVRIGQTSAIARNIDEIVQIESGDRRNRTWSDRLADVITAFSGSMLFVWLHVAWFAVWVVANLHPLGLRAFDAYPFGLLTMIVSLEANREAGQADRRSHIDLQINLLAEQEITRLLEMVADIHERMGFEQHTADDVAEMAQRVDVGKVAQAVDRAEEQG